MSSVTRTLVLPNVRYLMTDKEYYSLKETYKFLCHLTDPHKVPRIPKELRDKAKHCLKDYPIRRDLRDIITTVDFFNPR